ncbi:MAG: hypothetical protein CVU62_12185 [Deltaproteobacteria bacterium HGW-Deltaproteobacteria-2]|jgi:hypothetical protein|nr:MAG: hypothetical protein CVU62_12185 [Deltaproteobacteria bacterium HGW-Deltaproteobacteria-2]
MKKYLPQIFLFFLITIPVIFAPDAIRADTMSSFTIEQEKAGQRWEIMGEFERSWISMTAANNYISWINTTWGGNISKMNTADGFSVRAIYRITPIIGVGLGYERFWAEASGSHSMGAYKMETSANGALAIFSVRYPVAASRLSFNGEFALGYYFADFKESENSWEQKGDDSAPGFRFEGKVSFAVTKNFNITAGGGYRYLKMDDFGVNFFSPRHPKAEVDYCGWFVGGGISIGW